MNQNKDKYPNVVVTGVWDTKNGHFNTMPLDQRAIDVLREIMEIGGKILVRKRSRESIAGAKDPTRTPPYYLEFVPATAVKDFEANRGKNKEPSGL